MKEAVNVDRLSEVLGISPNQQMGEREVYAAFMVLLEEVAKTRPQPRYLKTTPASASSKKTVGCTLIICGYVNAFDPYEPSIYVCLVLLINCPVYT